MDDDPAPTPSTDTAPKDVDRARDLQGRRHHPWIRRVLLVAMTALVVAALLGVFGQAERVVSSQAGRDATIALRAPEDLRSGLLWRARITVTAHTRIVDPQVILGPGYVAGMQLNTIAPNAVEENSRGDRLALTYPTLDAGEQLTIHLQLQVNPTTSGRQDLTVALEGDGVDPDAVRLPAHVTVHR
ncbi:MAG: hypothetical protein ITG02_07380 [Patulibacter sp.]|nr:hypothetical protein [Patulibacter sp.]